MTNDKKTKDLKKYHFGFIAPRDPKNPKNSRNSNGLNFCFIALYLLTNNFYEFNRISKTIMVTHSFKPEKFFSGALKFLKWNRQYPG